MKTWRDACFYPYTYLHVLHIIGVNVSYIHACILTQLVEEQTPKDYDTVTKYLQFKTGRFESALQIKLNKAEAEKCGWVITIESEKKVRWHNYYGLAL
jgi:hypothetical protein